MYTYYCELGIRCSEVEGSMVGMYTVSCSECPNRFWQYMMSSLISNRQLELDHTQVKLEQKIWMEWTWLIE